MQRADLPPRYARQLDGCGGMRVCVGVTLVSDQSDQSDLSDKLVRPCIPQGFAVPQCGLARAKSCHWVMQRADLPPRYARQLDGNGGMRVA